MARGEAYDSGTLFRRIKSGKLQTWRCWVKGNEIHWRHGQEGSANMQHAMRVCHGKNKGRANATAPEIQAVLEAKAMMKFRLTRNYFATREEALNNTPTLPMLACNKKWEEARKLVKYPCEVQPKFDGVRCLCFWRNGKLVMLSRGNRQWKIKHLRKQIKKFLPHDAMLDGEIYLHGKTFQEIISLCKREQAGQEDLEFVAFDLPMWKGKQHPWRERKKLLWDHRMRTMDRQCLSIKLCLGKICKTEQEVHEYFRECRKSGYEGTIIRNLDGEYKYGERSNDLLKLKESVDEEFKIIGFKTGKPGSKEAKAIIWLCEDANGEEFSVRPIGTIASRQALLKKAKASPKKYLGQMLKVRFQEYTDDKTPRFPRGVGVRPKEDIDQRK